MKTSGILKLISAGWNQSQDAAPNEFDQWRQRNYLGNAPHDIKMNVLDAYGISNAPWIETGTYLGDTTRILAKKSSHVYTIEPSDELAARAQREFRGSNVDVLHGLSEDLLPGLLAKLKGDLNLWLDGHYSAGITFEGPLLTPIEVELEALAKNLNNFSKLSVFIDDFRCFVNWGRSGEYETYPKPEVLVEWAVAHGFRWTVEQDIFVAQYVRN